MYDGASAAEDAFEKIRRNAIFPFSLRVNFENSCSLKISGTTTMDTMDTLGITEDLDFAGLDGNTSTEIIVVSIIFTHNFCLFFSPP